MFWDMVDALWSGSFGAQVDFAQLVMHEVDVEQPIGGGVRTYRHRQAAQASGQLEAPAVEAQLAQPLDRHHRVVGSIGDLGQYLRIRASADLVAPIWREQA